MKFEFYYLLCNFSIDVCHLHNEEESMIPVIKSAQSKPLACTLQSFTFNEKRIIIVYLGLYMMVVKTAWLLIERSALRVKCQCCSSTLRVGQPGGNGVMAGSILYVECTYACGAVNLSQLVEDISIQWGKRHCQYLILPQTFKDV